jgi:hypothetical protein
MCKSNFLKYFFVRFTSKTMSICPFYPLRFDLFHNKWSIKLKSYRMIVGIIAHFKEMKNGFHHDFDRIVHPINNNPWRRTHEI